ncbi:MAG: hypothetical protein WHS46_14375 [Desulfosoma sp.]
MPIYNPAQYKPIKKEDAFEGVLDFTLKNSDGTLVCFFTTTDGRCKIYTTMQPSKIQGPIAKARKYMVTKTFMQALNWSVRLLKG